VIQERETSIRKKERKASLFKLSCSECAIATGNDFILQAGSGGEKTPQNRKKTTFN